MTPRMERFTVEYPLDFNATQAAIRSGYSPRTAGMQGSRLMKNDDVALAIEVQAGKALAKLDVTAEDIVREAWGIAIDVETPAATRISALALLAKRHREFSDKQQVEVANFGHFTLELGRGED